MKSPMYSYPTKSQQLMKNCFKIIIGTILVATSYYLFQKPNGIIAPGLGGIAILLANIFPYSLGLIYFVLNIPLFLIGYRAVGIRFALYSLLGMISLSFFLIILSSLPGLHLPIIGCILSGLLSGIGIGFVIRAGGTTGGLDIASVVISKMSSRFTIGKTMIFVNAIVLLFTFIHDGFEYALFTFISMFIAGKSVDWMLSYPKQNMKGEVEI